MRIKLSDMFKVIGLLIVIVALSGCGVDVKEKVEDILDEQLPAQSPSEEELPAALTSPDEVEMIDGLDDELVEESVESLMAETEAVDWSSEIPEIFVKFKAGYCLVCDHIQDKDDDVWMLTFVDVDLDDVNAYNKALEKNGWTKDDEVLDLMYAYTKEDYETIATIGNSEDGSIWYTLYLSHEMPNESGSDLNHMDGGDIPKGYPENEVPVYSSSTSIIVGAAEINAGGSTVYSIEIGCDETPEDIVEEIYPYLDKLNEGKATKMLMNGNGLLQGASEEWYFTILIEAVEYNGKATSVVYQVTPIAE